MSPDLGRIRHVVLDMDGTIYRGGTLLDCTLPLLDTLRHLDIGYTFITNNSSRSIQDYTDKLARLGISVSREQLYTSTEAVIEYLWERLPEVRRLWLLGTESMARQMEEAGFQIDGDAPQAVVVGFDTGLTYADLCRTAWWISQELPFIASHPDRVCPTDEPTVLVDCGAITACLRAATGREPVVLGKPDPRMLAGVCHRHGLATEQLAVVGDRLHTDVAMAQRAGALSVLVLTGESTAEQAGAFRPPPDLVLRDAGVLGEMLHALHGGEVGVDA